jgi:hypothetical protein
MNKWIVVALSSGLLAGCNGFTPPPLPEVVVGSCTYINTFSKSTECKDYVGNWTEAEATADCKSNGQMVILGNRCGIAADAKYGDCIFIVDEAKQKFSRVELPGTDGSRCASVKRGCEFFGGGSFQPTALCGGLPDTVGPRGLPTFQQPYLTCKAPMPGEPAGRGEQGQVCTWSAISAATEEGRDFSDYGDCNTVRTQRPYYPAPASPDANKADPRMDDAAYAAEVQWVKQQVQATACVCCHTTRAPQGTSNWFLESGPNFANSFLPRGLAMGAGWINTTTFGAYPPEQNNGFTRATPTNPGHSIFVTTDDARMRRFFAGELAHRGLTQADFAGQTYGVGPLDEQYSFKPKACENGEGVGADGTITWAGSPARYLYVLAADSNSPGVPPNLDLPIGTQWRLDVPWMNGTPMASGSVKYGVLPEGQVQQAPAEGAPTPLTSGQTYYLYVMQDIALPVTRCLFTAP